MSPHEVDVAELVERASPTLDRPTWAVLGLASTLFLLFAVYTTLLYRGFWSTGSDLGSYVHMFSTTLAGQGFLQSGKFLPFDPSGSYWGAHFSLTLLLFLPVFALWPSPVALLVGKSAVLAASIPVLWLVARRHVDDDWLAGLLVVSYALNPFLWTAWVFDFQEQSLLPLFVFAAYAAYQRERDRLVLAGLALALLTNEFVAPIAAGALVGLAIAAYRTGTLGRRWRVLATGLGMVVTTYLVAGAVISRFNAVTGIPTPLLAAAYHPYVEGSRATVGHLLLVAVSHPRLVPTVLLEDLSWKVVFLVLLLVPTVFLAATDEVSVGALLPYLAFAWLFTGVPVYFLFGAHYSLYLVPFLYLGAIRTVGRSADGRSVRRVLAPVVIVAVVLSVAGALAFGIALGAVPHANDHTRTLQAAIDGIPPDASLVTQNTVYPHVATRQRARYVVDATQFASYQAHVGPVRPDYVLVDRNLDTRPADWAGPVICAFGDRLGTEYGARQYEDGIWVFERGYDGPTLAITHDGPASGAEPGRPIEPPPPSAADCATRIGGRGVLLP